MNKSDLTVLREALDAIGAGYTVVKEPRDGYEKNLLPSGVHWRLCIAGPSEALFTEAGRFLGYSWMGSDECDYFTPRKDA